MTPYRELFQIFGKIGLLSFGGPAGQIALMHTVLVDEKHWLDEKRFLHALNFCMLLPGPEAMQLATYCGWLLRGIPGGLLAGVLFVLPGALVIAALSAIYVYLGDLPLVDGALFGLKAAVLAIVIQALTKVAKRALKVWPHYGLAIAALIALAVFNVPFPLVILSAALIGFALPSVFGNSADAETLSFAPVRLRYVISVLATGLACWFLPVLLLYVLMGQGTFSEMALFFSKAAVVTFGGAYAVLAYVGQQAVEHYGWLEPGDMLAGLGLAETTPGPLILVLVFVGFVGAFRDSGMLGPLAGGLLGAAVTLWVTFIPCFLWIFLGAPYIERLRGNRLLTSALSAITAAVVGVIANLSLWFAVHVLFAAVTPVAAGPAAFDLPVPASFDWRAGLIAIAACLWLWRGGGLFTLLIGAVAAGMGLAAMG